MVVDTLVKKGIATTMSNGAVVFLPKAAGQPLVLRKGDGTCPVAVQSD